MRQGLRALACAVAACVAVQSAHGEARNFAIDVGKDTTRMEGPRRADGTIDYLEALRGITTKGVTAENNAAAVLGKAVAAFRPPPNDLDDLLSRAEGLPWKEADLPGLAKWLDENDEALTLLVVGSRRSRLAPLRPVEDSLHETFQLGRLFWTCRGLIARSMRRAGGGDAKGAIADFEAVRRIARLVASLPEFGGSVSSLMDRRALAAAVESARQAGDEGDRRWLEATLAFEELPRSFDWLDKGERFSSLNKVMRYLRGEKQQVIAEVTGFSVAEMFTGKEADLPELRGDLDQADWNAVLREINRQVDAALEIAREPEPGKRREKWRVALDTAVKEKPPGTFFDALGGSMLKPEEGDFESWKKKITEDVLAYLKRGKGESVKSYSERMGRYFAGPLSVYQRTVNSQDREQCLCQLYQVTLALKVYRKEKGSYPEKLAELAPGWLKAIPRDVFSGSLPVYRRTAEDYQLYSVGPDGRDDGGQNKHEKFDDVSIRRTGK